MNNFIRPPGGGAAFNKYNNPEHNKASASFQKPVEATSEVMFIGRVQNDEGLLRARRKLDFPNNEGMSASHLHLWASRTGIIVADNNSTNGTSLVWTAGPMGTLRDNASARQNLFPGQNTQLVPGQELEIGNQEPITRIKVMAPALIEVRQKGVKGLYDISKGYFNRVTPFYHQHRSKVSKAIESAKTGGQELTLGRLELQDKEVSGQHFKIHFSSNGTIYVADLGSTNGTCKEYHKTGQGFRLVPNQWTSFAVGDKILAGPYEIEVKSSSEFLINGEPHIIHGGMLKPKHRGFENWNTENVTDFMRRILTLCKDSLRSTNTAAGLWSFMLWNYNQMNQSQRAAVDQLANDEFSFLRKHFSAN